MHSDHRNYRAVELLPNNVTAGGILLACTPVPRIELWILLWRCLARRARVDDAAIGRLARSGLCSSHLSAQARLYLPSPPPDRVVRMGWKLGEIWIGSPPLPQL